MNVGKKFYYSPLHSPASPLRWDLLPSPFPKLDGLVSEQEFIEPDSKFIEINGVNIHYKAGAGEQTFILLHPFGGSTYSWREVMDEFAKYGRVIALRTDPHSG
ncbi:MAG: hypothetical protein IPG80_04545 [Anaerolineales bacterium]|uniref:alpha/beta fold hydrolase n=1 Tax=Candidatus Villigracilis vicinus TaxID=3140679 RepID=UPI00313469AA|nr:hypothetical protein [Anaerolineales bacterium]